MSRHINDRGLDLITSFESLRLERYLDAAGLPTIGCSVEVLPVDPSLDERDRLLTEAVLVRNHALTAGVALDRSRLLLGDLGIRGLAVRMAILLNHILGVVRIRAKAKVSGIHASRVVAGVENDLRVKQRPSEVHLVAHAMGSAAPAFDANSAISLLGAGSHPKPAAVRRTRRIRESVETLRSRLTQARGSACRSAEDAVPGAEKFLTAKGAREKGFPSAHSEVIISLFPPVIARFQGAYAEN